jgi:hypothetical protein
MTSIVLVELFQSEGTVQVVDPVVVRKIVTALVLAFSGNRIGLKNCALSGSASPIRRRREAKNFFIA